MKPFDVKAAKADGYSDAEIADELGRRHGIDVSRARANGISDSAIVGEMSRLDRKIAANNSATRSMQPLDVSKMSGLKQFQLGVGSGLTDIATGVKDIAGLASDQEVMAKREADAAITGTGAGIAGNVAGKVIPALAVPFGMAAQAVSRPVQAAGMLANSGRLVNAGTALGGSTILDSALIGGGLGALEATAGDESRMQNMAVGGAVGAAVPVGIAAVRAGKAIVSPLVSKTAQDKIAADALIGAMSNPRAVSRSLAEGGVLVPGSQPTTAAVTRDLGLATAEKTARALDPASFAATDAANNAARVAAARAIAQTPEAIASAEQARKSAAVPILKQASGAAQGAVDTAPLLQRIDEVLAGPARKREAAANALSWIRGKVDDANLTFDDLYAVRQDIDDALAGRLANDQVKGIANARREVMAVKRQIDKTLNDMSGGKFGEYTRTWGSMSKPIEQMRAGQEIMSKGEARAVDALGNPRIRSGDIRGFLVKKGENRYGPVFSDEQRGILSAIADDIDRSNIVDAVRPRGSDTFQNLVQGNILSRSMGQDSPVVLQDALQKATGWIYKNVNQNVQQTLINALRDPNEAARLIAMAPDEATKSAVRKTLSEYGSRYLARVPQAAAVSAASQN